MSRGLGFADAVQNFADNAMAKERAVFETTVNLAYDSIVHGSAITGAPGQPVSTRQDPPQGHLADSWRIQYRGQTAHILTHHTGAPTIELGTRLGKSLVLHVGTGGFHSLALTRAAFLALVEAALAEIGENPGAYLPSSEGL